MAGGNVPAQYAPIFQQAGKQYGIPASVLAGVASVETNLGANNQTSSTGARGLMQFEPGTAASLGVNVNDPRSEIFGAAKLLVQYGYHQNPARALGAYNGGPGNPQYSYAQQVISEAKRLAPQLTGSSSPSIPGIGGQQGSSSISVPVTTQGFDQAGFKQAMGRFIAGQFVKSQGGAGNPYNASPGASKGFAAGLNVSNPLLASGQLTTSKPNAQDFVTSQTRMQQVALAQSALQGLAGGTVLAAHPALQQATVGVDNIAGGFLPKGATYVPGRKDQGRDGQTNPGGAIVADGNGFVVNVLSDPGGFGPRYPVIHFTSGRYAGRTLYFGHTLATVKSGQRIQAGQVISHTGTSGVGNATVPGWFEIGFADSGSPGQMGQPAPF